MIPKFHFPVHWYGPDRDAANEPVPDRHLVGHAVNGFIAAKQAALYEAENAYYRTTGLEALERAHDVVAQLNEAREAAFRRVTDDERPAVAAQLEKQLADALDGINRHVAEQHKVFGRDVLAERQRLIERAAGFDYNDDDKLAGLAAANASAATALAELTGEAGDAPAGRARSAVWRNAIAKRLESGSPQTAMELFERVRPELVPADLQVLTEVTQA